MFCLKRRVGHIDQEGQYHKLEVDLELELERNCRRESVPVTVTATTHAPHITSDASLCVTPSVYWPRQQAVVYRDTIA